MNGILLGAAMLVSTTGAFPAPELPRAAAAPFIFNYELPDPASRDLPGRLSMQSVKPQRRPGLLRAAQATRAKPSRMHRIIAVAAGASIGWFAGAAIGFAVTPKRDRYDDTSGLKGALIGAPIGGAVGAFIGYRLTR